jgi:hypothetical protein
LPFGKVAKMIYASLRLQVSTLAALRRYRNALQCQIDGNHLRFARFGPSFKVSLDGALEYLIDQQASHRARAAASRIKGERAKDAYCDQEREAIGNAE